MGFEELERLDDLRNCHEFSTREIIARLDAIKKVVDRTEILTLQVLKRLQPKLPVNFVITQGASMLTGTIKGLAPGANDEFFATPVDINGNADSFPAGSPPPVATADDPGVVIAMSADGLSASVTAPTGATVGGSFNLTWNGQYTDPASGKNVPVSSSVNVPYIAPPALQPVGFVVSQGAPATPATSASVKGSAAQTQVKKK